MTTDAAFAEPLTKAAIGQDNRWRGLKQRAPEREHVLSNYLYRHKYDLPPEVRIVLDHRSFGV
jgi:hypothetical protein